MCGGESENYCCTAFTRLVVSLDVCCCTDSHRSLCYYPVAVAMLDYTAGNSTLVTQEPAASHGLSKLDSCDAKTPRTVIHTACSCKRLFSPLIIVLPARPRSPSRPSRRQRLSNVICEQLLRLPNRILPRKLFPRGSERSLCKLASD